MFIRGLYLRDFRCYIEQDFEIDHQAVLLTGPNGSGKTSILEMINVTAVSKSFLPVGDAELTRHGALGYCVRATVQHDVGTPITITVEYASTAGKRIVTSASGQCTAHELIGLVPTVVLATVQRELFIGEPGIRRAFVDRILSQSLASYKHALWRHRAALRQRNRLLSLGTWRTSELDAWTEELLASSSELMWHRKLFVDRFNERIAQLNHETLQLPFTPVLEYIIPWLDVEQQRRWNSQDELRRMLDEQVPKLIPSDYERMTTQWGPQRDLLTFVVGTSPLHSVTSQGQQKMALFIIKLAEAATIESLCTRAPVLLLDDLFSDLDIANIHKIERAVIDLSRRWQVFMTAPDHTHVSCLDQWQCIRLPTD